MFTKPSFRIIMLMAALLTASCKSELDSFKDIKISPWSPDVAIPLVDDTLTVRDVVAGRQKDSSLRETDSSMYVLVYENKFNTPTAEELINIDNWNASTGFTVNINQTKVYNSSAAVTMGSNRTLNYIACKGGTITYNITSTGLGAQTATLEFVNLTNAAGVTLSTAITTSAAGTASGTLNLAGYNVTMPEPNSNRIFVRLTFPTGANSPVQAQTITIRVNTNALKFRYIEGYVGALTLHNGQMIRVNLDVFDNKYVTNDNEITWIDPRYTGDITNSIGVPVNIKITNLRTYDDDPNAPGNLLSGTGVDELNPLPIPAATKASAASGPSALTPASVFKQLDRNNTNITQIVNFYRYLPHNVGYTLAAAIPATINTTRGQFVFDTSRIRYTGTAILPCDASSNGFYLVDTVDVDLPKTDDKTQLLSSVIIKTVVNNNLPVGLEGQIYFVDSAYNRLDSLVSREANGTLNKLIAEAAPTNPATYRTEAGVFVRTDREFEIEAPRYNAIQARCKQMIILYKMHTYQGQRARLYPDYRMHLQVGVRAKLQVDPN